MNNFTAMTCYVKKENDGIPSEILIPAGENTFEEFRLVKPEKKQPEPKIMQPTWSEEEIRAYHNDRIGLLNAIFTPALTTEMIEVSEKIGGKLLENMSWLLNADIEELVNRFAGSLPKRS